MTTKSFKITWQTENLTYPLPSCLWPQNVAVWWLTLRGSYSHYYSILWSRGLARLRYKLKPLYLFYHNAYSHRIDRTVTYLERLYSQYYSNLWLCGFKRWGDKLKPLYPKYLSAYATKPGRMVTYLEVLLSINHSTTFAVYPHSQCLWPRNSVAWWFFCMITWQISYHSVYGQQTLHDGGLT